MKTRIVVALAAALALPAAGHAQNLRSFRSEAELAAYLRGLPRPERGAAPQQGPPASCGSVTAAPVVRGGAEATGPAVIHGRVTGTEGTPIPGAIVRIMDLNLGATSAADGSFRLVIPAERLPQRRSVTAMAGVIGRESRAYSLELARGDSARADYALCAATLAMEGVVVTAVGTLQGRVAGASVEDAAESVTNNQHQGVDEGGIVKVHGDHLVMLRRGRLFTVAIGNGKLEPVSSVDAFGPGLDPEDGWYDELLVSGDQVVVLGYSYGHDATEVGIFHVDARGRLSHRATYHLRSDDYYSSRNYASRLVGTKLVIYTPLSLDGDDVKRSLPALRRWRPGAKEEDFRPIISATRIFRPGRELSAMEDLTLHTIMVCDLARPRLSCEATAVLGPWARVFYVSPTSVYVWVSEWERERRMAPSMVYRFPLSGAAPSAMGASGTPVDQFSFLESGDGHLNVLVRAQGRGEGMWRAERSAGDLALLRVPLSRFTDGRAAPASSYRNLPAAGSGALHNRFVGRHLLYGDGNGWGRPRAGGSALYAVPWAGGAPVQVPLPHGIDRIEVMGGDAVVVGADARDLHFTGIALRGRPRVAQRYVQRGASQGELRSHGFFYRPDDEDSGTLGLPIRGPGRPGYEHLFDESASILFLRNENARFREVGQLASRPELAVDDHCVASCVDWYGNARPLFLRGRVFALLGYEIVEGALTAGRLRELRRVSYAPAKR